MLVDRVVWERYGHAGFVVDKELQILLVRGDTSPYLQPAPGIPVLNLLKMLREELALEVRAAMQNARRTGSVVRREAIRLKQDERLREVNLEVHPLTGSSAREKHFLILFETMRSLAGPEEAEKAGDRRNTKDREVARLNRELKRTKEYLQAIIQEQEAANEELTSANEEALSSMEELQSTNEELETAQEELQSTNEELVTMNEQSQTRNAELAQLSDDLANVLSGINVPIVLLGGDRRIRRFTPTAEKLLHLLPGDVGRPIGHIRLPIDLPEMDELISQVIDQQNELTREIRAEGGRWYSLRILPYKTRNHTTEGVLISLGDIHEMKRSQETLRSERDFVTAVLDAASNLLVMVLDREKRIVQFNRACQELTGFALNEVRGRRQDFLLLPEELGRVNAAFDDLIAGKHRQDQYHWVTKGGNLRLIGWYAGIALDDEGSAGYTIHTGIDLSEHERVKEHIRESEATVRASDGNRRTGDLSR